MPIVLQCPNCGKHYSLPDDTAGRHAKCRCGQVIEVPRAASEKPDSTPAESTDPIAAETPPPETGDQPPPSDAASTPPPGLDRSAELPMFKRVTQRGVVGVLSVLYGGVMALVCLFSFRLIGLFFAALIAVGGVLILRRHRHGPACAGIASGIFCFFPLVGAVSQAFSLLSAVRPGPLIALVTHAVLVYTIPVLIVIWTIREETAAESESGGDYPR
jgi:hypothetical protein